MDSVAGMDLLIFPSISPAAADALFFEDDGLTRVHEYSDLDLSRLAFSGSLNWKLSRSMGILFGFLCSDFQYDDPYLADTGGTHGRVWAGVLFRF